MNSHISEIEFDPNLGLGHFPEFTFPHEGSIIGDRQRWAAQEFGWRCAEEVASVSRTAFTTLGGVEFELAKTVRNAAFTKATQSSEIRGRIIDERDAWFEGWEAA